MSVIDSWENFTDITNNFENEDTKDQTTITNWENINIPDAKKTKPRAQRKIVKNSLNVENKETQLHTKTEQQLSLLEKIKNNNRRNNIDNKFCLHKIGYKRWVYIGIKGISNEDKELWKRLFEIGANIEKINDSKILCATDTLYSQIRSKLSFLNLPNLATDKKNKPDKMSKADKIRAENTQKRINAEIDHLISLKDTNFDFILNYKYAEMNIAKMILFLQNTDKQNLNELVIAYTKFLQNAQNTEISRIILNDLEYVINCTKQKIKFDPIDIILKNPELVFKTKYDKVCNVLKEKVYNLNTSQKEIFEFIKTENPYLALVHSMLGSGKTSLVQTIAGYYTYLNKNNGNKKNAKILYCCPNDAVLMEISRMSYSSLLPFAIIIRNQNINNLEYKFPDYCKKNNNSNCVLYICDIFVARILLEQRKDIIEQREYYTKYEGKIPNNFQEVPEYLFIGDELTKDADKQTNFDLPNSNFSLLTEVFIDILKLLPNKSILMSASLPAYDQLKELYDDIGKNKIIKSFSSAEAKIGCSLISNNELFIPYKNCKTVNDIQNLLQKIKTNPFIGRFFTFKILLDLVDKFKEKKLDIPDISQYLNNPSTATQYNIQKMIYTMLLQLDNDELIQKICGSSKITQNSLDINELFKSEITKINKFKHLCMFFTNNPILKAIEIYKQNFGDDIFNKIKMNNIINNYNKKKDEYTEKIKRLEEKKDDGINKQNKANNTKERVFEQKDLQISKLKDKFPIWDFPNEYVLCSEEHLKKYNIKTVASSNPITCEELPETSCVSNELLTMLASGIAVYSTEYNLDEDYLATVLTLAKLGKLKFIFSDTSLAYGTNLSCQKLILDDTKDGIVDICSILTLLQCLGRAGREGLSYVADIYTLSANNNFVNKMEQYILGTLDEENKDEVKNIKNAYELLK